MKTLIFIGGMLTGAWFTVFIAAIWQHFPAWSMWLPLGMVGAAYLALAAWMVINS